MLKFLHTVKEYRSLYLFFHHCSTLKILIFSNVLKASFGSWHLLPDNSLHSHSEFEKKNLHLGPRLSAYSWCVATDDSWKYWHHWRCHRCGWDLSPGSNHPHVVTIIFTLHNITAVIDEVEHEHVHTSFINSRILFLSISHDDKVIIILPYTTLWISANLALSYYPDPE